ncbi:MAG TPA: HAD family hydrolase [Candidatus Baltobacteraceae bacterium]
MISANPRRINAVGFDFDHTLGIDNKLERVAFLRLLDAACKNGGRCIGTLAQEIERIDELLIKQRAGAFSIEEAVLRFMEERGVRDAQPFVDGYKRMAVDMADAFVIPQPGVREMLADLRRRAIPVAILTNGWSPLQQKKAERVEFDGPVLVSADLGCQKPGPRAFAALARALGVVPDEIAFVGDTPASDVAGSMRAGMHGIWFDAQGLAYPEDLPSPSAVIHSLAELTALV